MTRPASILWFERLLVAALAIDLTVNLASWGTISSRLAAQGISPNPLLIGLIALASPLFGGMLLYFVARRRSRIARWIIAVLVALGTLAFAVVILNGGATQWTTAFAATVAAELIKLLAVTRLFTAEAKTWFAAPRPSA